MTKIKKSHSLHNDCLFEIRTEELPPKSLLKLAASLQQSVQDQLQKTGFEYKEMQVFATPRRLALYITQLAATQPDQLVERKGPALNAAFDAAGAPTPACVGFARSCGVTVNELIQIKNAQGAWVAYKQQVAGKSIIDCLPDIITQALLALPIAKRMRWGNNDVQFVRPIHAVILLYGDELIKTTILGCKTSQVTQGHRFMAPQMFAIKQPADYLKNLEKHFVIADFNKRRDLIRTEAQACIEKKLKNKGDIVISDSHLLDEVTGLVEWPVALCGEFDAKFLSLPQEVLISAMQDHQRYFPVVDQQQKLLPYFVTISNIESHDPARVIHGNERVLRARLADAAFFYEADKKETSEVHLEKLKGVIFQAKLGTLYEKAERLNKLTATLATVFHVDKILAERAAWLVKTDLTSQMVGEFPELQGVMGRYYALLAGKPADIADAIREHYLPRFASDDLPQHAMGQALALADRIDTLIGMFAINQLPTGDKDPFGLRRAALGVVRILIEKKISLDLKPLLAQALMYYPMTFDNKNAATQVLHFIQERMRAWYLEQGGLPDVFAAVAAVSPLELNPYDMYQRMQAVLAFKQLKAADSLSAANKRVSNILTKYTEKIAASHLQPDLFEHAAEKLLAQQLELKNKIITQLQNTNDYNQILLQLAELRQPIDDFFDHVMVMTEDKSRRENRILLLTQLRFLFLQVADIALLQS